MPKISPQIVLITGSSSGFGFLTASHLASQGHIVYASMRHSNRRESTFSHLKNIPGEITVCELDVTKPDSVQKIVQQIATKEGYLDVVVNNAGYGIGGFFEDLTADEIRQQMEVNFFGVQNVTRAVIPLMRSRRKGKIINISSVAGLNASPCFGAYNASKWALEGFSESLYHELKLFGIDVCMIEPGTYKTKIFFENSKYAKDFDNPNSPYYAMSQRLKARVMNYVAKTDKKPVRIAYLVEKLMLQKNPALRNFPDIETQMLLALRKILPFGIYSRFLQKALYQDKLI